MDHQAVSSKVGDTLPLEPIWTEGVDGSTLRALQARVSQLAVTQDIKMFTWSIHCTRGLVDGFLESPPDPLYADPPMKALLHNKQAELNKQMEVWSGWDPLLSIARHATIRNAILECAYQIPVTETAKSIWRQVLAEAMARDRTLCVRVILGLFSSKSCFTEQFSPLSPDEKRAVLNVCQSLIDAQVPKHRKIERYLKKFVRYTGILPHYLFVSGIERHGGNALMGGGFADIWRGEFNKQPVALKVLRLFGQGEKHQKKILYDFCKEAMIWRQLNHENVLPLYGVSAEEFTPRLAMVLPWMSHGNMMEYLNNYPNANRTELMNGVAAGLHYLHGLRPQVIHGDLRGVNILIDEQQRPRIADFGLARVMDSQATTVNPSTVNGKGNCRWQAPELLQQNHFGGGSCKTTTQSDIYSFACIMLEIFTDKPPFSHLKLDGQVLLAVVQNDQRPPHPGPVAIKRGLTDVIWQVMQDCWSTEPSNRPSMAATMQILRIHSEEEGKSCGLIPDHAAPDFILNMLHIFDLNGICAEERDEINTAENISSIELPIPPSASASTSVPTSTPSFCHAEFFTDMPVSEDPEPMGESESSNEGDSETDSDRDDGLPSDGSLLENPEKKPSYSVPFGEEVVEEAEDTEEVSDPPSIHKESSADEHIDAKSENAALEGTIPEITERQRAPYFMVNPLGDLAATLDQPPPEDQRSSTEDSEDKIREMKLLELQDLITRKRLETYELEYVKVVNAYRAPPEVKERQRRPYSATHSIDDLGDMSNQSLTESQWHSKEDSEDNNRKLKLSELQDLTNQMERELGEREKANARKEAKEKLHELQHKKKIEEGEEAQAEQRKEMEEEQKGKEETEPEELARQLKREEELQETMRHEKLMKEREEEEKMRKMREIQAERERVERRKQEEAEKLQESFRRREEEIKRRKQEMKAQAAKAQAAQTQSQASRSSGQAFGSTPQNAYSPDSGTSHSDNSPAGRRWIPGAGTDTSNPMAGNHSLASAFSIRRATTDSSIQNTPQTSSAPFSAQQRSEWQRRQEEHARKQQEKFSRELAAQSGPELKTAQAPTQTSSQTFGSTPQSSHGNTSGTRNASHASTRQFWTPKTGVRTASPMARSSSAPFGARPGNSTADSSTKGVRQHTEDSLRTHPNPNQQERGQEQKDYNRIWEEMSTSRRKERMG